MCIQSIHSLKFENQSESSKKTYSPQKNNGSTDEKIKNVMQDICKNTSSLKPTKIKKTVAFQPEAKKWDGKKRDSGNIVLQANTSKNPTNFIEWLANETTKKQPLQKIKPGQQRPRSGAVCIDPNSFKS